MWKGVDYFLIDEVSMLSCNTLAQISMALTAGKGSDLPYGGISLIFAGDFAQLPPVKGTRLYKNIDVNNSVYKPNVIDAVQGRLLWLSTDTVVRLKTVMRQSGALNENFVHSTHERGKSWLRGHFTRESFKIFFSSANTKAPLLSSPRIGPWPRSPLELAHPS